MPDADVISQLLAVDRLAIVGLSDHRQRPSHDVARSLVASGKQIVPVNPRHDILLGEPCYPSLGAIPDPPALAVIFRASAARPGDRAGGGGRGRRGGLVPKRHRQRRGEIARGGAGRDVRRGPLLQGRSSDAPLGCGVVPETFDLIDLPDDIPPERVRRLNNAPPNEEGAFVLYWMQAQSAVAVEPRAGTGDP